MGKCTRVGDSWCPVHQGIGCRGNQSMGCFRGPARSLGRFVFLMLQEDQQRVDGISPGPANKPTCCQQFPAQTAAAWALRVTFSCLLKLFLCARSVRQGATCPCAQRSRRRRHPPPSDPFLRPLPAGSKTCCATRVCSSLLPSLHPICINCQPPAARALRLRRLDAPSTQ